MVCLLVGHSRKERTNRAMHSRVLLNTGEGLDTCECGLSRPQPRISCILAARCARRRCMAALLLLLLQPATPPDTAAAAALAPRLGLPAGRLERLPTSGWAARIPPASSLRGGGERRRVMGAGATCRAYWVGGRAGVAVRAHPASGPLDTWRRSGRGRRPYLAQGPTCSRRPRTRGLPRQATHTQVHELRINRSHAQKQ